MLSASSLARSRFEKLVQAVVDISGRPFAAVSLDFVGERGLQASLAVDHKLAEAKDLLSDLEAEERERVLASRGTTTRVPASVPASGRAAAAVQYAMAQVGDAYVYGAMGENAFDCSGLTMRAWAQAGVGLPHQSRAQYASVPHVPQDQAQPGDLIFQGAKGPKSKPAEVDHAGIYLGGGWLVHSSGSGTTVIE